jgi:hypothetical protein
MSEAGKLMADALQKISQLQGGDVGKFAVSISKF